MKNTNGWVSMPPTFEIVPKPNVLPPRETDTSTLEAMSTMTWHPDDDNLRCYDELLIRKTPSYPANGYSFNMYPINNYSTADIPYFLDITR